MIYPDNALDKLGFTEIRHLVAQKCISVAARELVERMRPLNKFEQINLFLNQTHECRQLLVHDQPLPMDHLFPVQPLVEKARVEGIFLTEEEFFQLGLSLRTLFALVKYFRERTEAYPHLQALFQSLKLHPDILRSIVRILDDKGQIRDQASPTLAQIALQTSETEQEVRKKIAQIFRYAQGQGWTADGQMTVRDGRLCIPILAENKRKIKGYIHDESSSGQTVYLEPEEVFQLNNQLRDLAFERRREIMRILIELTDEIRPFIPDLITYHHTLTRMDFVRAKALFALDIDAEKPALVDAPIVHLYQARHPLLQITLQKEKSKVVPLDIHIDEECRIVLVSGPNAGGKSVCMKTVGLLQLMLQSGLLIPALPQSQMGIFHQFFADIGDDQSIESDLSTYSAHLSKMKYFVTKATPKTLILIDEFGTGTDPQFGGPMAEAVLEVLHKKKGRGVITTHYSNLKNFAASTAGVENASMLFDHKELRPLYVLQMGKPGSSYAFEIAQKIGLPAEVLDAAKQKIGVQQKQIETLLVDLERDKMEVIQHKQKAHTLHQQAQKLKAQNEELQQYLESNKNAILRQAKEEAKAILKDANQLVEKTISDIKKQSAEKEKTKQLRVELHKANADLSTQLKHVPKVTTTQSSELEIGDWVRLVDSGAEAQIIEIAKNKLILAMGELRTVVKSNQVEKLPKKAQNKQIKKSSALIDTDAFYPELDVRGMRTEDALFEMEKAMDKALMKNFPNLKIIHGKGNGILRKFIREYLRKFSQVTRVESEHPDRGGDGITYAHFD
jgi:DNA mismatch repair protein MutS2